MQRKLYFFLTRKTVFSKKTALSCIFFRISIVPYRKHVVLLYGIFIRAEGLIAFKNQHTSMLAARYVDFYLQGR